ncbi:hypothetical protein [Methanocalculus sp. MC3]
MKKRLGERGIEDTDRLDLNWLPNLRWKGNEIKRFISAFNNIRSLRDWKQMEISLINAMGTITEA